MDCEYVRENTVDYLKKELSEKEMNEVREHLSHCGECREYLKDCEKLINSYPDFEKSFPFPQKLNEKIKKSLEKTSVL